MTEFVVLPIDNFDDEGRPRQLAANHPLRARRLAGADYVADLAPSKKKVTRYRNDTRTAMRLELQESRRVLVRRGDKEFERDVPDLVVFDFPPGGETIVEVPSKWDTAIHRVDVHGVITSGLAPLLTNVDRPELRPAECFLANAAEPASPRARHVATEDEVTLNPRGAR